MHLVENLISICIPTFNRPSLLVQAIESCLVQRYRPLEIIIGDDSPDDEAQRLTCMIHLPEMVELIHIRNRPSLRQAGNVNNLFRSARGSRLVLLHDDDLLYEGGLDALTQAWDAFPHARCVFGKQQLIDATGSALPEAETDALNVKYCRVASYEGRQKSGLASGLRQQIPNNGFLVETLLASEIQYRPENIIGQSVDADFGIRLGASTKEGEIVFINKTVSKYRLSENSIMRSKSINHGQHLFYSSVEAIKTKTAEEEIARRESLDRLALEASLNAAMAGERRLALHIMRSQHYKPSLLSPWSIFRLVCIISPQLGMQLGKRFRRR